MPITNDDYPGATEFGANPTKVSSDTIRQIEFEATDSGLIGTRMRASLINHPKLGSVLILDQEDGSGGFVLADRVSFIAN
jgi:hypothetical protein